MALSLVFSQYSDFFIDDTQFIVTSTCPHRGVTVADTSTGTRYPIHADKSCEIAPGVSVSEGDRSSATEARLLFEAHPRITILRGTLYRETILGA